MFLVEWVGPGGIRAVSECAPVHRAGGRGRCRASVSGFAASPAVLASGLPSDWHGAFGPAILPEGLAHATTPLLRSAAICSAVRPMPASTASVSSPRCGAEVRRLPGVADSLGTTPGTSSV